MSVSAKPSDLTTVSINIAVGKLMDLDDDTVFFSKSIAPELVFLVPEETHRLGRF